MSARHLASQHVRHHAQLVTRAARIRISNLIEKTFRERERVKFFSARSYFTQMGAGIAGCYLLERIL